MENEKEKSESARLRCTAFGDLRPAEIRPECEECEHNAAFADKGGCPGMLLTGSRENLAAAMRAPGGIAFEDVVVVNAKRFEAMEKALRKIAEKQPAEYYECGGECSTCDDMIEIAQKALEVNG